MNVLLKGESVFKSFDTEQGALEIIQDLNFEFYEKESIAITGPSGCGKSTLLNLIAGLEGVTQGDILFQGESLNKMQDEELSRWRRENTAYIFQDFRLLPKLNALENVALPLQMIGESTKVSYAKSKEILSQLGLENRLQHFPKQLSGGEQQRVALARAFVADPQIILADEPTGNLDPKTSAKVIEQMLGLKESKNSLLVLVTHDLSLANKMDRQLVFEDGQLK